MPKVMVQKARYWKHDILIHSVHAKLANKYKVTAKTLDDHLWGRSGRIREGGAMTKNGKFAKHFDSFDAHLPKAFTEYVSSLKGPSLRVVGVGRWGEV